MGEIADPKLMQELKAHARELKAGYSKRDSMFKKYTEMYLIDWREKANRKLKNMQVTASPDFRNQVQGATRLMVATDPQINVESKSRGKVMNAERVEEFLKGVLYQSGRLAGEPIHYPLITTGILYDEMHAGITATMDILERLKKAQPETDIAKAYQKAEIEKWEEIADTTAFIVEPWHPGDGYPEFGPAGLSAFYRVVELTVGEVADRYGELPDALKTASRSLKVNLHTIWDAVYSAVWLDQGDLVCGTHGFTRVPVMAQILNGSRIFSKPEDQRQPIGYTLLKSNLWNAQNLSLTAIFTAVLNQAWNPTKVYTPAVDGSTIEVNQDDDQIDLHPGDRLDFVQNKGLIDPGMREALGLATQKGYESGIYPQALGAPAEGDSTFSELALLSQSGRLPLIGPQRRGGWGISGICEIILSMVRSNPEYRKGTGLEVGDIPRGIEIATKLEVTLPQDKLQQSNILNILTDGENPKVSLAWALENVLNINNPEEMRRQIMNERAVQMLYMGALQKMITQALQEPKQSDPGGDGGEPGGEKTPPGPDESLGGNPDQGPPMDAGPMMPEGQGEMVKGGLPPQMAGVMPGAGKILAPDEEAGRRV